MQGTAGKSTETRPSSQPQSGKTQRAVGAERENQSEGVKIARSYTDISNGEVTLTKWRRG